jgi:hypothetical protein
MRGLVAIGCSRRRQAGSDRRAALFSGGVQRRSEAVEAVAAGVADHQWTLEEVVEMIDNHFEEKLNAQVEVAFAAKAPRLRTKPKTLSASRSETYVVPRFRRGRRTGF